MNRVLWKMPKSATTIVRGPVFTVLPQHQCEISFSIEAEDGSEKWLTLKFEGVEGFKATYLKSLGSVDRELRSQAYETVISVGDSNWLADVKRSYQEYCGSERSIPISLQHLILNFDDGPCYEVICGNFTSCCEQKR